MEIKLAENLKQSNTDFKFDYDEFNILVDRDINEFISNLKEVQVLPLYYGDIFYESDTWDFSRYYKVGLSQYRKIIYFTNCPEEFKDILKVYTLMKVLEDRVKIQTIHGVIYNLMMFARHISDLGCKSIYDVTPSIVDKYLGNLDITLGGRGAHRTAIRQFYEEYSIHFDDIRTPEFDKVLKNKDWNLRKAEVLENKTDNIPDDYFAGFLKTFLEVSLDTSEKDWLRGVASIYLIMSQTGLRLNECLALETNSLRTTHHNGQKLDYLLYKTSKRTRGSNKIDTVSTYANEITIQSVRILEDLDLYKMRRKNLNKNYLFMGSANDRKKDYYPYNYAKIKSPIEDLFVHVNDKFETINLPNNYYKNIRNRIPTKKYQGKVRTIAWPLSKQFRVRVVNELIEKGVQINYVQKFMSHLTKEVTVHYATPKEDFTQKQKMIEESRNTLKSILTKKEKLIGKNSQNFLKEVQVFIKNNDFNIAKDLDEIIDILIGEYPIRQKAGGYLVSPVNLRGKSKKDSYSDIYFEKYGFETSGLTFFYMIPNTYKHAVNQAKIVQYNLKNDFKKEAQTELLKLKNTLNDLLEPEIEELEEQLLTKGLNQTLQSYPDLMDIINDLDAIKGEVEKWKKLMI